MVVTQGIHLNYSNVLLNMNHITYIRDQDSDYIDKLEHHFFLFFSLITIYCTCKVKVKPAYEPIVLYQAGT